MIPVFAPPRFETLQLFQRELWKDQRQLDRRRIQGRDCLLKSCQNRGEVDQEAQTLRFLGANAKVALVPEVVETGENYLALPYVKGIRLFNLFVELDRCEPALDGVAQEVKRRLLKRCEANQREIQQLLFTMPSQGGPHPYPAAKKLELVVVILADALGIRVDRDRISAECTILEQDVRPSAAYPFRDATAKNMALQEPRFWLGNYESSEEERREAIQRALREGGADSEAFAAPIIDFDFSSCVDDTTPEDDVISLKYHERTWSGPPRSADELVWNAAPSPKRAAMTFVLRYFRFGGRKAAYRLLHPVGHRIRFRHDNDAFYFERLPSIVLSLWPEASGEIPEILEFTRAVARSLVAGRPDIDYFIASRLGETRRYYVDMYPE